MSTNPKKLVLSRKEQRRKEKALSAEAARIAASSYLLLHFPFGYTGGAPRRLRFSKGEWWIVPILLTSPAYGIVGEAGVVAIDAATGRVVGCTDRNEAVATGDRLREGKRDEIEAAFLRTRTA